MIRELQLTPEELFYLGKLYDGEYFNYSYYQAVKDIGNNKRSFKNQCKEALLEKKVIEADLLGDIVFNEEIKDFLSPVYFGKFASSIDLYEMGEEQRKKTLNIHFHQGSYLLVYRTGKSFQIQPVTEENLKQLIVALMPEKYNESKPPENLNVSEETLRRVLLLKNIHIGGNAVVNIYYDYDSYLCEKRGKENIYVLSPKEFFDSAFECLKGDE